MVTKLTTDVKNLDLDISSHQFQALTSTDLDTNNQKWFIIGGCVAAVAAFVVFVTVGCWMKIKKSRFKLAKNTENKSVDIERGPDKRLSTSTDSSVDSLELPKSTMIKTHRNLRHSLSFDVCAPYLVRKHSVQPVPTLPRWNSLTSPRTSVTAVKSEKSSDSEDASASVSNTGKLWFSLLYNERESILQITLIRAKYLPARGLSRSVRDPFVKIFIMPDEENCQQSKVRKRTLSPKFNEVFNFKVKKEDLCKRSVKFSVYDMDKKKIRHCLGHVIVALDKIDLKNSSVTSKELDKISQCQSLGELEVSLACNPFNNRLKISIAKVKNINIPVFEDPVVINIRAELFHGQKLLKHKTITARNILDSPKSELIFHEAMSFGVPAKFYDSCYVALIVIASGVGSAKEKLLGKINLGPFLYARGENLVHWQEMISNPRTIVTRWHKLEPTL